MADIFLSYARQDKARAALLAKRLTAAGWSVFWDPNIAPGDRWDEVLSKELDAARVVVVAWSATAIKSPWVREEATIGKQRDILVPVIIDDTLPPLGFTLIQAESLAGWNGASDVPAVERVIAAIRAKFGGAGGAAVAGANPPWSMDVLVKPRPAAAKPASPIAIERKTPLEASADVLPLSKFELIERLSRSWRWTAAEADAAKRFFRSLSEWRNLAYSKQLSEFDELYFPFNPDTYMLRSGEQSRSGDRSPDASALVAALRGMLEASDYRHINSAKVAELLAKDPGFGLQITTDLAQYEILDVYVRAARTTPWTAPTTSLLGLFVSSKPVDLTVYRRIIVIFKLKSVGARVAELTAEGGMSERRAKRLVETERRSWPRALIPECAYVKQYRDYPESDIAMLFPNSTISYRTADKVRLGINAGAALGIGAIGAAGKIALLMTNPIAAAGAVAGIGGIIFRQAVSLMNVKARYQLVLAQNLYLLHVADNRNVMTLIADHAEEEKIVAELLLYFLLNKEPVHRSKIETLDRAIEQYLLLEYGASLKVDIYEALSRLSEDGLVTESPDGMISALPPALAFERVEQLWIEHFRTGDHAAAAAQ